MYSPNLINFENQIFVIFVIFYPTCSSHHKLNQKLFCRINSFGKSLHLADCASVHSKSDVTLEFIVNIWKKAAQYVFLLTKRGLNKRKDILRRIVSEVLYMSFDKFLLAVESHDLSQADKSITRVSSFSILQNLNFWMIKFTVIPKKTIWNLAIWLYHSKICKNEK